MGFLSDFLKGASEVGKTAKDLPGGLLDNVQAIKNAVENAAATVNRPDHEGAGEAPCDREDEEVYAPSGESWGPFMPDEENQFNYNGTFTEYFENIFLTEFSEYRLERENVEKRVIYSFYDGSSKALVVELMPEQSTARRTRSDCEARGIPYLRYYYDHKGWWNTRSYVTKRTRNALSRH